MLTRIVQPSPALESFLDSLHLPLSQPQRDHLLHLVDGSLVCEERKTLAALQRQFLDSTDPSNWADFLRISPWFAEDVRCAIRRHQVAWLVAEAQRRSLAKVLYVNLDDSLGKKDKRTSRLEPVDWFHDHNESTPRHSRYYKTFCYLECTLHAEDLTATADLRLYLRDKTVRRLNRHRPPEQRLHFRSKFRETAAAGGLGDLRPVRQLVRFGAAAQIHPSSRLARSLWPEEQPEVLGATPRSIRHHLTAQAVHACARDRCGREHDDVSRAGRRGTVVESSL